MDIIRQVATSLIRSIVDNPSKLRLFCLDIRGYVARLCYLRGLSHGSAPLVFDGPLEILERFIKYHYPEYHPLSA